MPIRPCLVEPVRNAIAIGTSVGASLARKSARRAVLSRRPGVVATAAEVATSSRNRTERDGTLDFDALGSAEEPQPGRTRLARRRGAVRLEVPGDERDGR